MRKSNWYVNIYVEQKSRKSYASDKIYGQGHRRRWAIEGLILHWQNPMLTYMQKVCLEMWVQVKNFKCDTPCLCIWFSTELTFCIQHLSNAYHARHFKPSVIYEMLKCMIIFETRVNFTLLSKFYIQQLVLFCVVTIK